MAFEDVVGLTELNILKLVGPWLATLSPIVLSKIRSVGGQHEGQRRSQNLGSVKALAICRYTTL